VRQRGEDDGGRQRLGQEYMAAGERAETDAMGEAELRERARAEAAATKRSKGKAKMTSDAEIDAMIEAELKVRTARVFGAARLAPHTRYQTRPSARTGAQPLPGHAVARRRVGQLPAHTA